MSTPPVLTLIIPTRERADLLPFALRTALDQSLPAYEVIVSDNASEDSTASVVRSFNDARLRYVNPGRRLSMCDHWDFALEHARGQYVVFIGDDDALLPEAAERFARIATTRPYPAYYWTAHIYVWPIDGRPPQALSVIPPTSDVEIDLRGRAARAIRHGGWKYWDLPGVYHCAVARRLLDEIRIRTGRVFHTTQPDLFTCMAVPTFTDRALALGTPLSVNGRSARSNGGASIAKDGAAVQRRFVEEYGAYRAHPTLPPSMPDIPKLMADTFLVAMDLFPEYYAGQRFGYEAMWAFMCRVNLARAADVLRRRRELRTHHPFNIFRFLGHWAFQHAAEARLRWRQARPPSHAFPGGVPSDVTEFARLIGRWQVDRLAGVPTP